MKRFHVHVAVTDLAQSTRFYSAMFGASPNVQKDDYAKWMLDDPRINFAISSRGNAAGVNHLGLQAENASELADIHTRLQNAGGAVIAETGASCCYARSDKYWLMDPSGIAWESFHTLDSIPTFNGKPAKTTTAGATTTATAVVKTSASACCSPVPDSTTVSMPIPASMSAKGTCCD